MNKSRSMIAIRFLIGLNAAEDPRNEWRQQRRLTAQLTIGADSILGRAGMYTMPIGRWQGQDELTLVWETIQEDTEMVREAARNLAARLARNGFQDSVGLVFAPVIFELVGPEPEGNEVPLALAPLNDRTAAGDEEC